MTEIIRAVAYIPIILVGCGLVVAFVYPFFQNTDKRIGGPRQ